jgi:hypothetical protein
MRRHRVQTATLDLPGKRGSERSPNQSLVPHPPCCPHLYQPSLSNHRQYILRDRIESRHRLRIGLESPLRHDQIRKLC